MSVGTVSQPTLPQQDLFDERKREAEKQSDKQEAAREAQEQRNLDVIEERKQSAEHHAETLAMSRQEALHSYRDPQNGQLVAGGMASDTIRTSQQPSG